jgi:hypothetical protein
MTIQAELFKPLKNLTGEQAWLTAKQVSTGKISYEKGVEMVASKTELDNDLRYIDDIVNQHSYC